MSVPTLLIIDDHQLIRDMWTKVLQDTGQVQVIKYPGRLTEAMEIIRDQQPDVILLDVYMSPITGFDLLPQIKIIYPDTRVIGFSVHANAGYAKQMLQMGAHGYITKNSEIEVILTAIKEVIKGNTYVTKEIQEIMEMMEN